MRILAAAVLVGLAAVVHAAVHGAVHAAGAPAAAVRFVCADAEGEPDRIEIDFQSKTALSFDRKSDGSVAPEKKSSPAKITKTAIRWPDILDGSTYSLDLRTHVLTKWIEKDAIYIKKCRKLGAGSAWP